jgi:GNAT superfamily N-acetyltransferase
MNIEIRDNIDGLDGDALKQFYSDADFDNDRTPAEYATAFGNSIVRLAYADGIIIGMVRAITDGARCAAVFDLAVLPKFRRQGVGRQLMQSLIAALPRMFIILTCPHGREAFYAKLGFEPTRFPCMVLPGDMLP